MTLDEFQDNHEWLWNICKFSFHQNEIKESLRIENIKSIFIQGDWEIPDVKVVYNCGTISIFEGFLTYRIAKS